MTQPTEGQLAVLAAYVATGSTKDTAAHLGIALSTVKNQLSELYARLDVGSAMEAAVALGWVSVPTDRPMCGWVGLCSRLRGHRGHHGGFRGMQQGRRTA